jgi:hypothetical protein
MVCDIEVAHPEGEVHGIDVFEAGRQEREVRQSKHERQRGDERPRH